MQAHCDAGAWVGGLWVPIEQCADKFLCRNTKTSDQTRCTGNCQTCPRSRTHNCAAKPDGTYDICIIGAGCIGSAIARELSKTTASVIVLEGGDDVSSAATKGNSGLVHAGFDDKPGSVRAKFCPTGCRMFPQLDRELHFGFQRNSSLVIARGADDEKTLEKLLEQGKQNGVENLRIIDRNELLRREPEITPHATAALLAEDAGTIVPYEFCIALAENAVDNGVELRIRRVVAKIEKPTTDDGVFTVTAKHWEPTGVPFKDPPRSSSYFPAAEVLHPREAAAQVLVALPVAAAVFLASKNPFAAVAAFVVCLVAGMILMPVRGGAAVSTRTKSVSAASSVAEPDLDELKDSPQFCFSPSKGTVHSGPSVEEKIRARFVVNCAGCGSDEIAAMVGHEAFKVNPRHGDYILLNKNQGKRISACIFPCPGPMGKGVLVQATLWGNLILGPTARDEYKKDPVTGKLTPNEETRNESEASIIHKIISKCRELVPGFAAEEVIHTFSGARAKTTRGDWIIESSLTAPRMIHAAGIDSPGLAASPAIAIEVVRLLAEAGAPVHTANPTFNPNRAPLVMPKKGLKDVDGVVLKYAMNPADAAKDPRQNVVCKCEKVTEAEIVGALRRSLPVDNTQAVRRRTRAGMGHCQGDPQNYCCEDRVARIIARETGRPLEQVGRRAWPASSIMPRRWFGDEEKQWVAKCGRGEGV